MEAVFVERKQDNHYEKYGRKWYEANKEKELLRAKQYYIEKGYMLKKEAYPNRRKAILKYRYGITPEDFEVLFFKQNGKCAICRVEYHLTMHIDHDHVTGKVRGLLCNNCNRGLGHFKDSYQTLANAIQYLRKSEISGHGGSCGV